MLLLLPRTRYMREVDFLRNTASKPSVHTCTNIIEVLQKRDSRNSPWRPYYIGRVALWVCLTHELDEYSDAQNALKNVILTAVLHRVKLVRSCAHTHTNIHTHACPNKLRCARTYIRSFLIFCYLFFLIIIVIYLFSLLINQVRLYESEYCNTGFATMDFAILNCPNILYGKPYGPILRSIPLWLEINDYIIHIIKMILIFPGV